MFTPPPKAGSVSTDIYDTVVDNTSNPSIFVVFYDNQCYPDYMITFKGTISETERVETSQEAALSSGEVSSSRPPRRYRAVQFTARSARGSKKEEATTKSRARPKTRHIPARPRLVSGEFQTCTGASSRKPCDVCSLEVFEFICMACYKMLCEKCQFFSTDQCEKTQGQHEYLRLRGDKKSRVKSSERGAFGSSAESTENWNCARCTFLNPTEHSVCSMCATTRGVSNLNLPEPGSRVCRGCTFHNKEGSHVCAVCGKTLRLDTIDTTV